MPNRPATPCRHPGCPTLVYQGGGYCHDHAGQRMQARRVYDQTKRLDDPVRRWAKEVRDSGRWKKVRRYHKQANPTCCDPFKRHGEYPPLTAHTHHIRSLISIHGTDSEELAYDDNNLASLCTACHNEVEGMERRGQPTAELFKDAPKRTRWVGFA